VTGLGTCCALMKTAGQRAIVVTLPSLCTASWIDREGHENRWAGLKERLYLLPQSVVTLI
jgi:hypothetical protein